MFDIRQASAGDFAIGRTGKFASESVLDWWVWGYRSQVAPTFWVLVAIVVVRQPAGAPVPPRSGTRDRPSMPGNG